MSNKDIGDYEVSSEGSTFSIVDKVCIKSIETNNKYLKY